MARYRTASSDEGFKKLTSKNRYGIVQSHDDWFAYVEMFRDDEDHLINGLDDETLSELTHGLVFKNGGLASIDYRPLADKFEKSDIYQLMRVFGLGETLAADHDGYCCEGRGTCKPKTNHICTSNC